MTSTPTTRTTTRPRAVKAPADRKAPATSATWRVDDTGQLHYTSSTGATVVLPGLGDMAGGILRKYRDKGDADLMYALLEAVLSPAELARLDKMPIREHNQLFKVWQEETTDGADLPK